METIKSYIITNLVLKTLREACYEYDFMEMTPVLLSQQMEASAIAIKDKSETFYLPVNHLIEKQMALTYLNKVFCLAPYAKQDLGKNSKEYLFNFFQFEIEWRTKDMLEVFDLGSKILSRTAKTLEKHDYLFNKEHLECLQSKDTYPYIKFSEALNILKIENQNRDLTCDEKTKLVTHFDSPIWLYDYPRGIKKSLYHKNKTTGNYCAYDLILPFGFGKLSTGGVRPINSKEIQSQSDTLDEKFRSNYIEWKNKYKIQTAGFGISLEKLLRFVSDSESVLDFIPYHDNGPNKSLLTI